MLCFTLKMPAVVEAKRECIPDGLARAADLLPRRGSVCVLFRIAQVYFRGVQMT